MSNLPFDVRSFLGSTGIGKQRVTFKKGATIFAQGDRAKNVVYIKKGGVKLTIVNELGREAVVAILGPGDFFGEGCLTTETVCIATAVAIEQTIVLLIAKQVMIRALRAEHKFSSHFIAYMLGRKMRVEQDLIDQLFNSAEKRLARTLLMLAHYGTEDVPYKMVGSLSQETLAEMIGATRPRVNFFMNKFRDLGFIKYSHRDIYVNKTLLSVLLHD